MQFDVIDQMLRHLPVMSSSKGREIYNFILENGIESILEIGVLHGKSANYMAAALDELGGGTVVAIDIPAAEKYTPNIMTLSAKTKLNHLIKPMFSDKGSAWMLRNLIIESTRNDNQCTPMFDLVFIDGYHSWECASLDFLLSAKLLKPGGWMVFDDINWTFAISPTWRYRPETVAMSHDYRNAPHVGDVFRYLSLQHSDFHNGHVKEGWGWIQKKQKLQEQYVADLYHR